jgi:hypothetical protein
MTFSIFSKARMIAKILFDKLKHAFLGNGRARETLSGTSRKIIKLEKWECCRTKKENIS